MAVTGHLGTDEIGLFVGFSLTAQLHFGHHETVVIAMELIHLKRMVTAGHKVAVLVDDATFAKLQQMGSFIQRNLFLKLIARQSMVGAVALYGQVGLIVAYAHPDGSPVSRNIALLDMAERRGGLLVGTATLDQELAFYL